MNLHNRSNVFGACLIAAAMLVAAPVRAAPTDYRFDLVEVGPNNSHVTIRLLKVLGLIPVVNALVSIGAVVGPQGTGMPTMTQAFIARPASRPGDYTIVIEPGMEVFELQIAAEVAGELEIVPANVLLKLVK
jgi:hypothetical protein